MAKNPVSPKLEQFLNNLAYLTISEPDFYEITQAAGVSFTWPETFGGGLVKEFIEAGGLTDRDAGMKKVRGALGLLESLITSLKGLTSIEDIRAEYQVHARIQRALDVGSAILKDPESIDRFIANFEMHVPNSVVSTDHEGIKANYAVVLEEIRAGKGLTRIRNFAGLTELVGGFNPGRLTVVLGGSGFGKSNLGLNLCYAASQTMGVAYVNMEMSFDDISKRAAVILSGKTWAQLNQFQISPSELPPTNHALHFTDGHELHVDSIIAWARGLKRLDPSMGFLYIDYDQKMILDVDHQTQEWRAMQLAFRRLEDLAKTAKLHVVIAAQMNSEGKISSSHRATFTAHTILTFRRQGDDAIIENSIKHRHAAGPKAVPVIYDSHSAKITEAGSVFDLLPDDASDNQRALRKKSHQDKLKTVSRPYKED